MTTPPGWYPDPSGPVGRRYFDGVSWTGHRVVEPVRRRPVWRWALAGALLLVIGGCGTLLVAQSLGLSAMSWVTNTATAGDTVDDGQLQFVVGSFGRAMLQADPEPEGEYVLANVTVSNSGTQPRSFVAQNQKLIDSAGRAYAAESASVRTARENTTTVLVNPGQVIEVVMRFDVPERTKANAIELHESASSVGATVHL